MVLRVGGGFVVGSIDASVISVSIISVGGVYGCVHINASARLCELECVRAKLQASTRTHQTVNVNMCLGLSLRGVSPTGPTARDEL